MRGFVLPHFRDFLEVVMSLLKCQTVTLGLLLAVSAVSLAQEKSGPSRPTSPSADAGKSIVPLAGELAPAPKGLEDVLVLAATPLAGTSLSTELFRQGAWVAAREEFGFRMLDTHLGEQVPEALPLDRVIKYGPASSQKSNQWDFMANINLVWQQQLNECLRYNFYGLPIVIRPGEEQLFPQAAVKCLPMEHLRKSEEASRGVLVKCLSAARFIPRPNRPSIAPIPQDVEALLDQMRETSQWAALRRLHEEIRTQGESDALVGGLVRGYANLALLTDYQWGGAPEVFQARSLLYAQRLVARSPQSATALRHRAYATALVGFHVATIEDLESAAKLKDSAPPPWWTEAVAAFVHFDRSRLTAVRKSRDGPLVRLLEYLVREDTIAKWHASKFADEYLQDNPDCYRVMNTFSYVIGAPYTRGWDRAFVEYVPRRLKELPDLPKSVADLLAEKNWNESQVSGSLRAAGDPATDPRVPTWAALGKIVQDGRFVQAFGALTIRFNYSPERVEEAKHYAALLDGHPMLPLIQSFAVDERQQPEEWKKLFLDPCSRFVNDRALAYRVVLQRLKDDKEMEGRSQSASLRLGETYNDLVRDLRNMKPISWEPSHRIPSVSPHCPEAVILAIMNAKPGTRFDEAEKKFSDSPVILEFLAKYYTATRRTEDVIRCWKKRLEIDEDIESLKALANVYYSTGRKQEWVAMIEAMLKRADLSSGHDQFRVQLSRHYLTNKEYAKAELHADIAAEGGTSGAILLAIEVKIAQEKWDEATDYFRTHSKTDPRYFLEWLCTCCRYPSVKGRKDAEEGVLEFIGNLGTPVPSASAFLVGRMYLLMGRRDDATELLERATKEKPSRDVYLFAAMHMDQVGKKAARDEYLVKAINLPLGVNGDVHAFKNVATQVKALIDDKETTDVEKVRGILKKTPPTEVSTMAFFLGWYITSRGDSLQAAAYFQQAETSESTLLWLKPHAAALRGTRDSK